jgi:hypothetical protein
VASIDLYADTFIELDDTPASFAGEADKFVRVEGGGSPDELVFFDLFGSANTWTGTNRFEDDVTLAADLLAGGDDAYDIGTSAVRFRELRGVRGAFTSGAGGSPTFGANQGGIISGGITGPGTNELSMGTIGGYPPTLLAGNVYSSGSAQISRVRHDGGGSVMFGSTFTSGANNANVAEVVSASSSYGSFTGGYATNFSSSAVSSSIINYGPGAFLWAYTNASGTGSALATISGSGGGGFCCGNIIGDGAHILRNASQGGFVQGSLVGGAGTASTIETLAGGRGGIAQGRANAGGIIRSSSAGAFAQGNSFTAGALILGSEVGSFAQGYAHGVAITASGKGSLARGYAKNYPITASGRGSIALGDSYYGPIIASATGSGQIGPGSNTVAGSLQIVTGVRIRSNGQVNHQLTGYGSTFGPGNPGNAEQYWDGADLIIDPDQLAEGSGRLLIGTIADDEIRAARHTAPREQVTLGAAATAIAITREFVEVTGDAGGNTIATITGGVEGQHVYLQFVDALVTITDDNTHAANSVDLRGAFTSKDDAMLHLIHDSTSWYEISRSDNAAPPTYTPTNVTTDRAWDCNATNLNELADVVATIAQDLQAEGIFG